MWRKAVIGKRPEGVRSRASKGCVRYGIDETGNC